ncbi:hypothetical protein KO498_07600 [Lentibacter algarum]|uniref:diacylglycerol/polyprenol kinase family protein n=1 Tax=Lentibacter algarum TaxID=576131 RepID=UPI001C06D8DD|nr:hypothetical protein [Lentibacter algarum]MBU2981679.1 hypothetical protein [Lentibacter algarum]
MSVTLQIILALASVATLLCLMAVVRWLAARSDIGSEVQRKLVHIGTGLYALTLPWLFPTRWPVYFLVGLTLLVMLVLRLPGSKLGKTLHSVERQSYGDFLLAISVAVCLFLAQEQLFLYVLPIAVLTLADAAAALAGSNYGTKFFKVEEGQKSIEGSAVFFTLTLLIAVFCLMLMTPLPPANIIVLSLMVAGFGTLVEAVSWRGFDNLFLPVGLLIFLFFHAQNPLLELLLTAALFTVSILAFLKIAPMLGLSRHAARVYVITVFVLLAVTEMQNAVMPILALGAHAWSRSVTPCSGKYPDLDIVAGLAFLSLGWLTLGNASGWNAISFYGLTAMSLVTGLCAVALSKSALFARLASLLAITAALCGIRFVVIGLNPETTNWNGPMWGLVIACLVLAAVVPSLFAQAFAKARVTKLALMSLLIPLPAYLMVIDFSRFTL